MASNPPGAKHLPPASDQALWDELNLRPIVVVPLNIANTTKTVVDGPGILIGWAFRETAAQATTVDFKEGRDSTGNDAGSTALAASGSGAQSVGVAGAMFRSALTLVVGGGTIRGAVWVRM